MRKDLTETFLVKHSKGILLTVMVLGLLIRFGFIYLGPEKLLSIATEDDAYYYAELAENIASGKGITYDGLTPSAGFHPLFAFIFTIGFILFKTELGPIYFMYLVNSLFMIISALLLFIILRRYSLIAAVLSSTFFIFNPYIIYFSINGMETSVYIMFFLLTVLFYLKIKNDLTYTFKSGLLLGILISLVYLSRADGLFLAVLIFLDQVYLLFKARKYSHVLSRDNILFFLSVALGFLIVSAPWILFNIINFGSIQPDSNIAIKVLEYSKNFPDGITLEGYLFQAIKQVIALFLVLMMMSGFGKFYILSADGYLNIFHVAFSVVFLALVSLILFYHKQRFFSYIIRMKDTTFLLFLPLLFLYYPLVLLRGAWPRYFAILLVLAIVILAIILSFVYSFLSMNLAKILCIIYCIFYVMCFIFLITNLHQSWQSEFYDAARWLQENTTADSVIGSPDSGIFGYFSHRRIINLDGVMNRNAAIARKNDQIMEYILSQDIDYIIDQEFVLEEYNSETDGRIFEIYKEIYRIKHTSLIHDSKKSYDVVILKRVNS